MANSLWSYCMWCCRAGVTSVRSRGFALMSPPPRRAATVISLMNLVNSLPRLASLAAFLCLIELHLEWPDMGPPEELKAARQLAHRFSGVNQAPHRVLCGDSAPRPLSAGPLSDGSLL